MRASSKKNTSNLAKPHPPHSKTLKRSKSTEQLASKKALKRTRDGSEEHSRSHTLIKCKSTKSLIPKSKHSTKSSHHTVKKNKSKKSLGSATVKKRTTNEMLSILEEEYDLKKTQREYFVYHHNYIPIENSAQRRLVLKIQMIDL